MGAITDEEKMAVDKFRARLLDINELDEESSDLFLIRWIRARNGNLDAAEKMLKEARIWRKDNITPNTLHRTFSKELHELAPYSVTGTDKLGRPVYQILLGRWDMRKILGTITEDEFQEYTNQLLERLYHQILVYQKERDSTPNPTWQGPMQLLVLCDCEGFSYSQLLFIKGMQNLLSCVARYEAYYPEVIGNAFIVNAPGAFSILFSMFKKILPPHTVEKIKLFGTNKEEWRPFIQEIVNDDEIGTEFGGTRILQTENV